MSRDPLDFLKRWERKRLLVSPFLRLHSVFASHIAGQEARNVHTNLHFYKMITSDTTVQEPCSKLNWSRHTSEGKLSGYLFTSVYVQYQDMGSLKAPGISTRQQLSTYNRCQRLSHIPIA
jgi:hypothetical protein